MELVCAIGAWGRRKTALARLLAAPVLLSLGFAPSSTESAIANGDTRTITLANTHTDESGAFTYMVDGVYDSATLDKLNWFLRDWRLNEPTKMDPKLFDIVWEVYRESGSSQPIEVLSAYRSPQTNALLRHRSRQVAKFSQHMEGKAIDAHFVDVATATIRDVAMRMQAGGVGFYPSGVQPWVHIDSGSVRYWPRMSRDALTRLFPDGKTVFIPSDGQPMPGYEQARAEIEARGGDVLTARADASTPGLFAALFGPRGGGSDDAEEGGEDEPTGIVGRGGRPGGAGLRFASAAADPLAEAKRDLPPGDTFIGPPAPAAQAPQVVASLDANARSDAAQFIAPLPPRKPDDIAAAQRAAIEAPQLRTGELAFAPAAQATEEPDAGGRDLVAALLERGGLPGAITRGVGASRALTLAPTPAPEPAERPALLARAAALAAPLPPALPPRSPPRAAASAPPASSAALPSETSTAPMRTAAAPPPATRAIALLSAGKAALKPNPYGDLVYDAFSPAPSQPRVTSADGLRGTQ